MCIFFATAEKMHIWFCEFAGFTYFTAPEKKTATSETWLLVVPQCGVDGSPAPSRGVRDDAGPGDVWLWWSIALLHLAETRARYWSWLSTSW